MKSQKWGKLLSEVLRKDTVDSFLLKLLQMEHLHGTMYEKGDVFGLLDAVAHNLIDDLLVHYVSVFEKGSS